MISVTINGTEVQDRRGPDDIAGGEGGRNRNPTLCHHEALSPYGSCRLCIVEIVRKGQEQDRYLVQPPRRGGYEGLTHSPKILAHRKMLLELLLARCPDVPIIKAMARQAGIEKPRFPQGRRATASCAASASGSARRGSGRARSVS